MNLFRQWPEIKKDLVNSENEAKVLEILGEIDTDVIAEYMEEPRKEAKRKLMAIGEDVIANKYIP